MQNIIYKGEPIINISLSNKRHLEIKLRRKKMLCFDSFYRSYIHKKYFIEVLHSASTTQAAFTCSELAIKTLEQGAKYIASLLLTLKIFCIFCQL